MNKRAKFVAVLFGPGIIALTLDQATKLFFPTRIFNQGVAFSLPFLSEQNMGQTVVIALLIVAISIFAAWHMRGNSALSMRFFYSILLGAALSNWIDRVMYSGVRDIWYVPKLQMNNNVADWLIVGSVIAIIAVDIRSHFQQEVKHEPAE